MKNKKFMIIGLIAILIVGLVSVFAIGTHNKSQYGHWGLKKCGDCTHKNFEDKGAWLEKMGLPSDATEAQIIEAKKELWGKDKADYMLNIREKLGLPDDASEEEVQEALQKLKEEKNFHKESWCGKS